MKNISSMVTAIVCASLISTALVQPIQAQQKKEQTQQGMQQQLQDVEARELAMKTEMDLIRKTNDLQERQRLLDEHLKIMLMQAQAMSKMSGITIDPGSREALLEQRTQLIMLLMDQMISHYQMQATCSAK
jgi:hypothetical protein